MGQEPRWVRLCQTVAEEETLALAKDSLLGLAPSHCQFHHFHKPLPQASRSMLRGGACVSPPPYTPNWYLVFTLRELLKGTSQWTDKGLEGPMPIPGK